MFTTSYAAGATDKSVVLTAWTISTGALYTAGAFDTSGLTLTYRRAGAAATTFSPATQTASGAHSDGGFVHLGNGRYRVDAPDAAFASGVDYVDVWASGVTDVYFTMAHVDITGGDPRAATFAPDAAATRSALGLASANLDTQLSAIAGYIDTEVATIVSSLSTITGYLDTEIAAILAKVNALPADPADASDIAALLDTIDNFIDTEIAAIKAKTDQLNFTVAGVVDANTLRKNGAVVLGNGTAGNKWRG